MIITRVTTVAGATVSELVITQQGTEEYFQRLRDRAVNKGLDYDEKSDGSFSVHYPTGKKQTFKKSEK